MNGRDKMQSEHFDPSLYTDPVKYDERPLRDRKAWLDLSQEKQDETRAEFVRDVISIANTVRRTGEDGYLIFGIDDDGTVCGVSPTLNNLPGGAQHAQRWEILRRKLKDWTFDIIEPLFDNWEMEYSDDLQGDAVFYVQIKYVAPLPKMYRVQANWPARRPKLRRRQSWIRVGESKIEITPGTYPYAWSYEQVPYILPSTWGTYLSDLSAKIAEPPEAYQDIYTATDNLLDDEIQQFIRSDQQILVIEGDAGCGKTSFLQKWISEQAKDLADIADEVVKNRTYDWTPEIIPIFYSLRSQSYPSIRVFTQQLIEHCHHVSPLWKNARPKQPCKIFESTESQWVLGLDGLDEIWDERSREKFIDQILRGFINRYRHAKIILTTRPAIAQAIVKHPNMNARAVQIRPFTLEQVRAYVDARVPENLADDVFGSIQGNDDFRDLCRVPLFLETAVEELADLNRGGEEGYAKPLTSQPTFRTPKSPFWGIIS